MVYFCVYMAKENTLQPFSEALIMERLRFENPWWVGNSIDAEYRRLKPRPYFRLFNPLVRETQVRRAVVLMGPRRVGKTVMLFHSIQSLLDDGAPARQLVYANIENPVYNNMPLEQLFRLALKANGSVEAHGWYVFFDEIQYLKDWAVHLKVLVDSYPNTRFVASGSAAAALQWSSTESGAGRFTDFMLPPLTFYEYIVLKELDHLMQPTDETLDSIPTAFFTTLDIRELNTHFVDYINFGGYPEVIFSENIRSNPGRYIRSDIVDKVLLRDLPSLYGIRDVQELNSLFTTLAYHSGNEVSLENLSQASHVEKHLLKKYLEYLEAAFLIRIVHRIDDTARRFQRTNFFKIYLTNPSLRSALFSPLQPTDDQMGNMVETAVFAQWLHNERFIPWYARWKDGEVDMVGIDEKRLKPTWALEIKWSNRFAESPGELKSLLQFCRKNSLHSAIATTIDKTERIAFQDITIHFVPVAVYAYTVAFGTMTD